MIDPIPELIRVAGVFRCSLFRCRGGALAPPSGRGLKAAPYIRNLSCSAVIASLALAPALAAFSPLAGPHPRSPARLDSKTRSARQPQAPQENAARVTSALAEARRLIDQAKPLIAIDRLKSLGDPTRPEVAHLLGVAYYHADDHVRAIEQLTPIVGKLPEGSVERREAVQILGLSHFIVGHFPQAVPFLEATRVWAADNPELGYVLGQTYVQLRQPDRARETFARTFGVAADSPAAHLVAAQMMIRLEFEDFAEAELKRAIEKDPKLPAAHALLGQLAIFRGRLDEGVALTEREIALNPGNAMAFSQLGDALVRQSKWDEAVVALQKSIWLNPFYSAPYILLGKAYMKKGQPGTAEGMLSRAIQYDPNNRSAHYLLGQLFQQTGRPAEAKREFDIAERLQEAGGRR